jgi:hypothetical protein
MPATTGSSAAPANNANSDPQTALSFRSNWQAQMAVLAKATDGDLNGLSAESGTAYRAPEAAGAANTDRGMQPAQGGSGSSLLASSSKVAGSKTAGTQNVVRAALAGNASFLNAGPAGDGYGRSGTGAPASRLNPTQLNPTQLNQAQWNQAQWNQAQLPAAVATLAALQQSAKAGTTDDPGTSKSTRDALPAKPSKQAEASATSLSLGTPVGFAAIPAPFAAAPATVIVPAETRPLASAPSSSSPAPFLDKTQSVGSYTSPASAAETAGSPSGAIKLFSGSPATEVKQLHNEDLLSYFDKTPSTNEDPANYFDKAPSTTGTFSPEARPKMQDAGVAQPAAPIATIAREAPIATTFIIQPTPTSIDESAHGATPPSTANRTGGPDLPAPLAVGALSAGETAGLGRIDTQVDLPLQGFTQVQHATVVQVHAQSGTADVKSASALVSGQEINRVAPPGNPTVTPAVPPPVAVQISANPVATNGSSASPQSARRNSRGTEAIGMGTTSINSQPAAAAPAETTSYVRGSAGVPAAMNPSATQSAISSAPSVRDTFAALDADPAPGAINWTHAGARQAEAGFDDPALGWVGVRADMSRGGVHATLLPGSVEAAQALGQHMDGLNAYMAQQHTPVESLAMGLPGSRDANHGEEHGLSQGMNQGMNQGTGEGTDQGQGRNAQQQSWAAPESNSTLRMAGVDGRASAASPVQPIGQESAAQVQGSRGMHISVVA